MRRVLLGVPPELPRHLERKCRRGQHWFPFATFNFTDVRGWQDLDVVNVLINGALDGRDACYLAYIASK